MRFAPVLAIIGLVGLSGAAGGPVLEREASAQPTRAWLGVELGKADGGVLAKHVVRNSPAAKAGLVDGDLVLSADGVTVDEPKQLVARVAIVGPNNPISLKVRHGGAERTVSATLAAFPGPDGVLRLDKLNTFAPPWKVTPAAGSVPANLQALRGHVVVLDFWATWCGPCRMMAPTLSQWQTQFGAQGLAVVGVTGDPVAAAGQAAAGWGMRYPVASDNADQTANAYGVSSLPTLFIVDKKGVIREVAVGYDPSRHRDLEKTIAQLLAEPAPSP
jgi:thiol-disulfide isomerase/thioredoxin